MGIVVGLGRWERAFWFYRSFWGGSIACGVAGVAGAMV